MVVKDSNTTMKNSTKIDMKQCSYYRRFRKGTTPEGTPAYSDVLCISDSPDTSQFGLLK